MRLRTSFALVALLLGISGGGAFGGDDAAPPAMEFRSHRVSALTSHIPWFRGERGPFPVRGEHLDDEAKPLYGDDGNESSATPFGSIDDLIEIVKSSASTPEEHAFFSLEGATIAASGSRNIVVRGPAAMQRLVAGAIDRLERSAFGIVTLDVLALRSEGSLAQGVDLAQAIAGGAVVPLAAARSVGPVGGKLTARAGQDFAYVAEQSVKVAQKAHGADPGVTIGRRGIAFDAKVARADGESIRVELAAWWAGAAAPRRVETGAEADPVETLETDGRSLDAVLDLVSGAWTFAPTTGGVVFAVRATARPHDTPTVESQPTMSRWTTTVPLPAFSGAVRSTNVGDLISPRRDVRGEVPVLVPSGYKPPEPVEICEPGPEFPADALIDTVKAVVDPAYWTTEGVSINLKAGQLLDVADDAHHRALVEFLGATRTGLGPTVRVASTVVTLPLASLPEYLTGLDDGATLCADGGRALLTRAGASVVDRGGVLCRPAQRLASVGGRRHSYIGDYDVEIAADAVIGKPVTREVLAGLSFDVECHPAAGGAAVLLTLRSDRTTWDETRQVKTSHGDLECPTLGVSRLRGRTLLPVGSTRIVGATLSNGVVTLTLVSTSPG